MENEATLQAMMQLLKAISDKLDTVLQLVAKYEPMLQRYQGWRRGSAGKQR